MKNLYTISSKLFLVAVLVLTISNISANAGDKKQIYERTQKLYAFLGNWEGNGKLNIGTKSVDVVVKYQITKAVDGWGIIIDQTIEAEGMDAYKSTSLLGYQPGHEHVHLFKISNYGETYDYYGYWIDESNYELKYEGMQNSKPFVEVMNMEFKSPESLVYSTESYSARTKISTFSVTLKRVNS